MKWRTLSQRPQKVGFGHIVSLRKRGRLGLLGGLGLLEVGFGVRNDSDCSKWVFAFQSPILDFLGARIADPKSGS